MVIVVKSEFKILSAALIGCALAGCTCVSTHVPGRVIDHGANPGGIDRFLCNLDYILFPPQQEVYVVPAPAVAQPVVVIPEYGYGWWNGVWVPRYQDWYWYHGTWVWGGTGMRPVPPAWAPDPKRPIPPPVPVQTVVAAPAPAPVVVVNNPPPPAPVVVIKNNKKHHRKPAPKVMSPPPRKPAVKAPGHQPAPKTVKAPVKPAPQPAVKAPGHQPAPKTVKAPAKPAVSTPAKAAKAPLQGEPMGGEKAERVPARPR